MTDYKLLNINILNQTKMLQLINVFNLKFQNK